jgi:hypothetical protein
VGDYSHQKSWHQLFIVSEALDEAGLDLAHDVEEEAM